MSKRSQRIAQGITRRVDQGMNHTESTLMALCEELDRIELKVLSDINATLSVVNQLADKQKKTDEEIDKIVTLLNSMVNEIVT